MVFTQLKIMELPSVSEQIDSVIINVTGKSQEEVAASVYKAIDELKSV